MQEPQLTMEDEPLAAPGIETQTAAAHRNYWVLLILIGVLLCLPIWTVKYPPLVDYPNHVARMNVLSNYSAVESYRSNFDVRIAPAPNLAMDLVVPPLAKFFEITVASKLFLTLAVLLFCIGCHLLGTSVHGSPAWQALICAFFVYNSMLFYGFVNYVFGLGVFLLTLALWLKYHTRWTPLTLVIVSLLTLAAYLSHLSSFVLLATAIGIITCFEVVSSRRVGKSTMLNLVPLIPPVIVFLLYAQGGSETKQIYFNGPYKKFVALSSVFLGYHYKVDAILAISAVLIALVFLFLSRKRLKIRWDLFTAGCFFGALFLFCPEGLLQTSSADARFVIPAIILIVISIRFNVDKRVGGVVLGLLLLLFSVRMAGIWSEWSVLSKRIEAQTEMFSHFDEGSRVYPIIFLPNDVRQAKSERPVYVHTIDYSSVYRHTISPGLIAIPGMHWLTYKRDLVYFHDYHDNQPPADAVNWPLIFDNYDYIWCCKVSSDYSRFLKEHTELIAKSDDCMIFRIPQSSKTRPVN